MKKQILNIGKALSRADQKLVFGGNLQYEDEGGPCRDAYPAQPAGCKCSNSNQCAAGLVCGPNSGSSNWWGECKIA